MKCKIILAGAGIVFAGVSFAQDSLFGPSEEVISARELGITQEEMRELFGAQNRNENTINAREVDRVTLKFVLADLQNNLGSVLNRVDLNHEEVSFIVDVLETLSQENKARVRSAVNSMCAVYNSGADIATTLDAYDNAMTEGRATMHDSAISKLTEIQNRLSGETLSKFDEYYESTRQMLEGASVTSFSKNIFSFSGNDPIPTLEYHCAQ